MSIRNLIAIFIKIFNIEKCVFIYEGWFLLYVKSSRLIENTNLNETQNNQCGTLTQLLYRKCFKLHSKVLFILITTCVFLAYVIFANLHIICIGKINDLNKKLIAYHHSWSTGRVFILKHFASKFMGKSFFVSR